MLFRDSFIYILSKLIPSGLGFATGIALSWLLSPGDYGLYGYGMAVAMMVATIGFDWLGLSFMRFKQKHADDPKFMPTVFLLFLGLSAAALGVMGMVAATQPAERAWLLVICTLGAGFYAYFELAGRVAVSDFQSSRYFWMNLVRNLGIFGSGVGLAYVFHSPEYVLIGGFAAMLVSALAFWRAPISPRRFDPALARMLFQYGMPMMVTMTLYASLTHLNRLLLEGMTNTAEVGYFTAATTIAANTLSVLANGVGTATYSSAVRQLERGEAADLARNMERNCVLLVGLLLPAAVGIAMLAKPIAELAFAHEYEIHVEGLLPWLAIATAIQAYRANYVDFGFQLGHRTGLQVWSYVVPAIANVALNVILIPPYGALGSAMAMTGSYALALLIAVVMVRRAFMVPFPLAELSKVALATGFMAAVLWPLASRPGVLALAESVAAGMLAFAIGIVASNVLGCRAPLLRRLGLMT